MRRNIRATNLQDLLKLSVESCSSLILKRTVRMAGDRGSVRMGTMPHS